MTNPIHILHDSSPTVSAAVPNQWFRTHRTGNLLLVGSTVTGGDVVLATSYELWRYAVFVGSNFGRYDQIAIAGREDKSRSNPSPGGGGGCGLGFEIALPLAILAWRRRGRSEDVASL